MYKQVNEKKNRRNSLPAASDRNILPPGASRTLTFAVTQIASARLRADSFQSSDSETHDELTQDQTQSAAVLHGMMISSVTFFACMVRFVVIVGVVVTFNAAVVGEVNEVVDDTVVVVEVVAIAVFVDVVV
jgi:hypothetical protein